MWTVPTVLAVIGGIALLAGLLGGIEIQQIRVQPLNRGPRILSILTGIACLALAIWLTLPEEATPGIPSALPLAEAPPPLPTATAPEPPTHSPSRSVGEPGATPAPTSPTTPGTLLLHTSLDDLQAIELPLAGVAGVALGVESGDFLPGRHGNGLAFTREGQLVSFLVERAGHRQADLERGEIEFWYRPHYPADSPPGRHVFFRIAVDDSNPPALELAMDGGRLTLSATEADWTAFSSAAPYAAPLWQADEWVQVRARWDAGNGADSLQLYLNERRVDLGAPAGGWDLATGAGAMQIFIGQANGHHTAQGIIDEFIIRR